MNKIWKFNDSKSNKLILIKDKIIYKPYTDGNELLTTVLKDLENNIKDYLSK